MDSSNPAAIPTIKNPWMDRHEQLCASLKTRPVDLLFLGDSITESWSTQGLATWNEYYSQRNAANLGISGERTQNLLWRILNGALEGISPRLIVMLIGTNNVGKNSPAQIVEGILTLVNQIVTLCPRSQLLLQAILPREKEPTAIKRTLVDEVNGSLANTSFPPNVHYLDIGPPLLDEAAHLPESLFPDGLHPTSDVYAYWAKCIEPIVKQFVDSDEPPAPNSVGVDSRNRA